MATLTELKELFAGQEAVQIAMKIYGATGFRTNKMEELTQEEIDRLVKSYGPTKPQTLEERNLELEEQNLLRKWKSKIIALAEQQGIKEPGFNYEKFNGWMLHYSIYKKHLNAHNLEELKALHKQLQGVKRSNVKSATNKGTKAWWERADDIKAWN